VIESLAADSAICSARLRSLLAILDPLLGAQGDQHAEHDDADFSGELTPTMQRFRKTETHGTGPPAVTGA